MAKPTRSKQKTKPRPDAYEALADTGDLPTAEELRAHVRRGKKTLGLSKKLATANLKLLGVAKDELIKLDKADLAGAKEDAAKQLKRIVKEFRAKRKSSLPLVEQACTAYGVPLPD